MIKIVQGRPISYFLIKQARSGSKSGKLGFCKVARMHNGLHYCVPLVEMIKNIYRTSNLEFE